MKTQKLIIAFFSIALFMTACSSDDDNNTPTPPQQNIVEIALGTPELARLVEALTAADLVNVLQGDGPFTVLAPTNAAFTTFLNDAGFASLDDVPVDVLTQVLLNHVIMADVSSSDLVSAGAGYASGSATSSVGLPISIFFDATNGVRFNNVSTVTEADIDASNGTIHIVNAVIGLPDIVDHASMNSGTFSSLVAALGAADGDLVNVLRGDGPFTVLAPDNDAFTTFLDGEPLGGVDTAVLSQILLNHVLGAAINSEFLVDAGAGYTITSATGAGDNPMSLYYNTSDGVRFNDVSSVFQADVVATNGIIHGVDAVIGLPTVVTFAAADPDFSTLVQALTELTPGTDFVSILSRTEVGSPVDGINPDFTVFAPTNAAFDALIDAIGVPAEPLLTDVLLYHVVQEANVTSGDLNPGANPVSPIYPDTFTINLPGTGDNIADITDGSGATDIGVIAVNVQAVNGVIHVLDKVMLPNL